MVTGVQKTDANGNLIGLVGNPNTRSINNAVFPNPSNGITSHVSQNIIDRFWLIPGIKNTNYSGVDLSSEMSGVEYTDAELTSAAIYTEQIQVADLTYDFTSYTEGFYRLFYRNEMGALGWTNIYIAPGSITPEINW